MKHYARIALAVLSIALVGGGTAALATSGGSSDVIPDCSQATLTQQCEIDIPKSGTDATQWQDFRSGEPEIAVNPSNPLNIVYVATKYKYGRVSAAGQSEDIPGAATELALVGTLDCMLYYSQDGGKSWNPVPWPRGTRSMCADPMVAFDPMGNPKCGTFHLVFDWMGGDNNEVLPEVAEAPPFSSHDVGSSSSTDCGLHWSTPVATGTTSDRPFFRIDPVTHKVYEASGDPNAAAQALFLAERGVQGSGRFLAVSSDSGVTWSKPVSFPGSHMAVNSGFLVTAAQTQTVNTTVPIAFVPVQAGTPQLTFYVSKDDGQTFTSYPVTDSKGNAVSGTGDYVSADPTHPGRFAVMQLNGQGQYEVYVTNLDSSGKPQGWTGPGVIANPGPGPNKPWMDFGPNGYLGVMWKTSEINVFSALSFDGGKTFSAPVRVNGKTFPAESSTEFAGDDLSWILVTKDDAYIGWGDTRSGFLNTFFARVPLSVYARKA